MTFLIIVASFAYNFTTNLASMPHLHIFMTILMTRHFSPHFHYKTIGANCKLHLHHIFTTLSCHQTIGANYKLDFHYIFTTKLLEPIVNYIHTTFSLHFHHIYMSPNHWSQLQTRFSLHFHHIYTTHDATLAYKISMW